MPRLVADPPHAVQHALRRIGGRRRSLHAELRASVRVADEEEVGERPADVHPEPVRHAAPSLSSAGDRRERRRHGRPALELAPEDALEPPGDLDQRVEVDSRLDRPRRGAGRRGPRCRCSRSRAARTGSRRCRRRRRRAPWRRPRPPRTRSRCRCCACCAGGRRPGRRARAAPPTRSRTCRGTPTPIVSAKTISSAPASASRPARLEHAPGIDRALERAAERRADRHRGAHPVLVRALDDALAGLRATPRPTAFWLRWLNVSVDGEREVHLVEAVSREAVVALLVERRAPRRRRPSRRSIAATTSSAPAIWGTRAGLTKLTASIRGKPAAASRSTSSARTAGSSTLASFWSPSRGRDVADGDRVTGRPPPSGASSSSSESPSKPP